MALVCRAVRMSHFAGSQQIRSSTSKRLLDFEHISSVKQLLSFDRSELDVSSVNESGSATKKRLMSHSSASQLPQRGIEDELRTAKIQLTQLESKLAAAELARKKMAVDHETLIANIRRERERETDENVTMKHQLEVAKRRESEAIADFKSFREDAYAAKASLETRIVALQKENLALEAKLDEVQQTSRDQIRQLRLDNDKIMQEHKTGVLKLEEAEEKIWQLDRKLRDCHKHTMELENYRVSLEKAAITVRELELKLADASEASAVAAAVKTQLAQVAELTKENRRLKDENEYNRRSQDDALVLREQLIGLEQKLEREQAINRELSSNQAQYEETQRRLRKLEAEAETWIAGSAVTLRAQLAELQKSNSLLLEKQGQLQAQLTGVEGAMQATDEERRKLAERLSAEEAKLQEQAHLTRRLARKLHLLVQERDSLQKIVATYESETTANFAAAGTRRLQEMETLMEGYKKHVQSLETELHEKTQRLTDNLLAQQPTSSSGSSSDVPQSPAIEVDTRITLELRTKIAELEKALEKEREAKERLEGLMEERHMQGHYDPTSTRVLHLAMNPVAMMRQQRAEDFQRLVKENEALALRLKTLEEAGSSCGDAELLKTAEKIHEQSNKELTSLRSQLSSAELKYKRLMETCDKTLKDLRAAIYMLLGYRLDLVNSSLYKLMNMYAESEDQVILFQQSPQGELQLLSNEYTESLREKIDFYLHQFHSFPAFLSSITLDLFNRQTMMQNTFSD